MLTSREVIEIAIDMYLIDPKRAVTLTEDLCVIDDIEYQFRSYFNGEFSSILIRFPYVPEHAYVEFYYNDGDDIEQLLLNAFSEETINRIECQIFRQRHPGEPIPECFC